MDKTNTTQIGRKTFHHNFLKATVLRLDFEGVLDTEMCFLLKEVKELALKKGFSRYTEDSESLKNLELKDSVDTNKGLPNTIYSFINDRTGFSLHVSSSFVCLFISNVHYIPYEQYQDIIPLLSQIYFKHIPFFTLKRFGIRKINECIIKDKGRINDYFNGKYFNCYDDYETVNTIQSNQVHVFTNNQFNINCITNIQQGKIDHNIVYKVTADIDLYLNDIKRIEDILHNSQEQDEANELIFKIYISLLTDSFIEKLSSEDMFEDSLVEGVEQND